MSVAIVAIAAMVGAVALIAICIVELVRLGMDHHGVKLREAVEDEAATTSWDPRNAMLAEIATSARVDLAREARLVELEAEDQPDPEPVVMKARARRRKPRTVAA